MSGTSKLTPEQLLALLQAVIGQAPKLDYDVPLADADLRWLGRAEALIEASGYIPDLVDFRSARQGLRTYQHSRDAVLAPLHNAYSRVELRAPVETRGAFIPAGDTWNGYAALVKLLQRDCSDLMVVDPYLDAAVFLDFLPHSTARNPVRCLTAKRNEYHPALAAAAARWSADPVGQQKPVEVRYAPSGTLHDRLIILDRGAEVWLISQSVKDIAKRSPASVSVADSELGHLKADHYEATWAQSSPI